jgi:hypothetical protein
MKIQDHFLIQSEDGRYGAVLVVNRAKIESPLFHDKAQAEKWLVIQTEEYKNA